jgi:hypothetical protein
MWINPPSVYDETTPSNHKTRRITNIVHSISFTSNQLPVHKHALTLCCLRRLFAGCTAKKNVAAQPTKAIPHRVAPDERAVFRLRSACAQSSSLAMLRGITAESRRVAAGLCYKEDNVLLIIILILLILGFGYGGYRVGPGWGYYGGGGISLILAIIVILLLLRVI